MNDSYGNGQNNVPVYTSQPQRRRMSTGGIVGIIVLVVLAILLFSSVGTYNGLVAKRQNVKTQLAQIDTELQRRNDLIPNLVNTVKGSANVEKSIYDDIASARAKMAGASTVKDKDTANTQLDSALSRLMVVVEQYPKVQSSSQFRDLATELEGTENRIRQTRGKYNTAAGEYNADIQKFPTSLIANMTGFREAELFQADSAAKEVPKVNFDTSSSK
ncbi:MAG: LemA family protein [Oscillospiraceae bacterium]|nr:LemA family protein [Oscillospiraceae bacterium]